MHFSKVKETVLCRVGCFFHTGWLLGFMAVVEAGDCCRLEQEFLAKQSNRTWIQRLRVESWTSVQIHDDQTYLAEILKQWKGPDFMTLLWRLFSEEILYLTHIHHSDPQNSFFFWLLFPVQSTLPLTLSAEMMGVSEASEAIESCFELFAEHFESSKDKWNTSMLFTFHLRMIQD